MSVLKQWMSALRSPNTIKFLDMFEMMLLTTPISTILCYVRIHELYNKQSDIRVYMFFLHLVY